MNDYAEAADLSEANDLWSKVFREGLAPSLSTPGLLALAKALREDDSRLIQGATTSPPPLQCVEDWPVEGACLVGYCGAADHGGLKGDPEPATVGEVENFFARACYECDRRLGESAACRHLLNAYDEWPRKEMIQNILPEVERELDKRREDGTIKE